MEKYQYYRTFESLRAKADKYQSPFVVQWEIPKPRDECTRLYIVFSSMTEYANHRKMGKFDTCHEVFVDNNYDPNSDELFGHPAFDIDIHDMKYGDNSWYDDFISDVLTVLRYQYNSNITSLGKIVWMYSRSNEKVSRHLVLHGITFAEWRKQNKILIEGMKSHPNLKSHPDIISAIDTGITRKLGSLRLPNNRKKGKDNYMLFEDPTHKFKDGIVLIYDETRYTIEGTEFLLYGELRPELRSIPYVPPAESVQVYDLDGDLELDSNSKLAKIFAKFDKGRSGLTITKRNGLFFTLKRVKSGICPISDQVHDSENAYIVYVQDKILFGCYRGCRTSTFKRKTIDIKRAIW
jgi:hypothetical protein